VTDSFSLRRDDLGLGRVRIAVSGEIDSDTSGELRHLIMETATGPVAELIIDLRDVTFIDAGAIRALLIGREVAMRQGCAYRVANARDFVHSVLAVAGVLRILGVRTTISARAAVSGDGPQG
jgi:anti-anti-sigma factor